MYGTRISLTVGLIGITISFVLGIVVVVGLSIGLVTLRNFGARLIARLPLPERAVEVYTRFEEGIFAIRPRTLPFLGALTGGIWATEGIRLFLVVAAFHFGGVHLGLSGAFFVALAGSLLTAVPFTPGGLGVVEAGVGALLTLVYGVLHIINFAHGATLTAAISAAAHALDGSVNSQVGAFQFGGNTYVFVDNSDTAGVTNNDVVVKLTGAQTLSASDFVL